MFSEKTKTKPVVREREGRQFMADCSKTQHNTHIPDSTQILLVESHAPSVGHLSHFASLFRNKEPSGVAHNTVAVAVVGRKLFASSLAQFSPVGWIVDRLTKYMEMLGNFFPPSYRLVARLCS